MGIQWAYYKLPLFIFLCSFTTVKSATEPQTPSLSAILPGHILKQIYEYLDPASQHNFERCNKTIFFAVKPNPIIVLPQPLMQLMVHQLSWPEIRNFWQSCKLINNRAYDPEKSATINAQRYIPYFDDDMLPTDKLINKIVCAMIAINKRNHRIPIHLVLAHQLLQAGIERDFLTRLFDILTYHKLSTSITELDLTGNFSQNLALSLSHGKNLSQHAENTFATTTINHICLSVPNLAKLILNRNELTRLPGSIAALNGLKTLQLSWNYILPHSLVVCQFLPQLTELDLSRNCLETIPDALLHMPTLRILKIHGNPLNKETRESLQNRDKRSPLIIQLDDNR